MQKMMIYIPSWLLFVILFFPFLFANNIPYGISAASGVLILWILLSGNSLGKIALDRGASLKWFNVCAVYAFGIIVVSDFFWDGNVPSFILPLHLLAAICLFFDLFYISRLLVISEEGKSVKLNRCIGTFLMFWFFPIGVWFVHPRVKRVLIESKKTTG